MTTKELLKDILNGRRVLVGNYRGSQAERTGYVDRKSGEAIAYIRAIHLIELGCGGNLDRAIIYQRLPEIVETPEEAVFPYERGRLYAFRVESYQWDRGQVIGRMGNTSPELIEDAKDDGASALATAPSGAAAGTPLP